MDEKAIKAALDKKFKEFEKIQTDLVEAQEKNASKDSILKLHASIETQGQAIEDMIEQIKLHTVQDVQAQFNGFLEENKNELANIKKNRSGTIEFIPKVVGNITTGSGIDNSPPALHNVNLRDFNYRNDNNMLTFASVSSTGNATFSYTELEPKDGDFSFVAEGVSKPQVDFKWNVRYATPLKIAAYIALTEESVTDVKRLNSIAKNFLKTKHDLFKANKIYFGTGAAGQSKGATVYGRIFSAGAMALKVVTPNFMDAINAGITDIFTTQNYADEDSYKANLVLISPTDFFLQMQSAKDANGLPLYPQASLFNAVNIGGVMIKPWIKIPDGKIFIADMKKYHVVNYVPYSIRIGWINDQFITNEFTMVGESRYFSYVENLDEQAFLYDDIATIITAITKP